MFSLVKEDGRSMAPLRRTTGINGKIVIALLATLATVSITDAARGQGGDSGSDFKVTVLGVGDKAERIMISLSESVTVETNMPVVRADMVAKNIADVQVITPTRLLITGQFYGNTTLILQGEDGTQHVLHVSVELDIAQINEALRAIDPLSDVRARSILGNVLVTGTVSSAERAKRIMEVANLFIPPPRPGYKATGVQNHLIVAGEQQVLLRCVVAEVERAATRDLGINGYMIGENFRDAFVVNQIGGINPVNIGAAASSLVTQNVPFVTDTQGLILRETSTLSIGFPRAQMQFFIKAMADNSLLKILAEPTLTAISGETATFLAGGEFPIPVPQGNQQVTIEFKEFGVRLNFTPIVLGQQRIRLRIAPEVSELDFTAAVEIEGQKVPGLSTRSMETTVELGNGETIAIAGLLKETVSGSSNQIPGLGDIPVLGAMFRSVSYRRSMSELVVLVTPEIVAPMQPHQKFTLPGEDLERPGDWDLYAMGLLEGNASKSGADEYDQFGEYDAAPQPLVGSQPDELSVHGPWGHAGSTDQR